MNFIPYIAAIIILAGIGYFMLVIYRAGKTAELQKAEANALAIKKEQDKADIRPVLTAGDILARMRDDKL